MNSAYLSLGSNEGNRKAWLQQAIAMLKERSEVTKQSAIYETAAWGMEQQPAFLNMALQLQTELSPLHLLNAINNIENELGRQRTVKWGQRTIDIDILFYNHDVIKGAELIIPHPYMAERRFVLAPLHDIAAAFIHPVLNKTVHSLLELCTDKLPAMIYVAQ